MPKRPVCPQCGGPHTLKNCRQKKTIDNRIAKASALTEPCPKCITSGRPGYLSCQYCVNGVATNTVRVKGELQKITGPCLNRCQKGWVTCEACGGFGKKGANRIMKRPLK